MIFDWFKKLFASETVNDPLWETMERMDPLLSYERFQALELSEQQRPLVKGLIEGTIKPSEIDAVHERSEQHGEDVDGIDAIVFALQHVLEGPEVTYVFEDQVPVPAARFPMFVDESALAVVFNDRACHFQITSLEEFVSSNDINSYTLEALDIDQLHDRATGRTRAVAAPSVTTRASVDRGGKQRITIERKADAEGRVYEPVGSAEIASALNQAGFNVTSDDVSLDRPIEKLGLYKVPVQFDEETNATLFVWVVPLVEPENSGS